MPPATNGPPKVLSTGLLTMKFMRRAAASPTTTPASPDQQRPAKRRKQSAAATNKEVDVDSLVDKHAIQAALSEEERLREAALDRAAEQAGDERWYLEDQSTWANFEPPLQITYVGWSYIDRIQCGEENVGVDDGDLISRGRRTFGDYKREPEKKPDHEGSSSESDEDEEESEDDEEDDPTGTNAMIKAARLQAAKTGRRAKRKAEEAESTRLAGLRKKKEVKLNRLSFGGGSNRPPKRKRTNGNDENDRIHKS